MGDEDFVNLGSGFSPGMYAVFRDASTLLSREDTMTFALSKFVSIPSISCEPAHREDCRQAAIWFKKCLGQLGARTTLVSARIQPCNEVMKYLTVANWRG